MGYTVVSILSFFKAPPQYAIQSTVQKQIFELRVQMTWYLFGAFSDMFLTCIIWFVFNKPKTPVAISQLNFTYGVIDVIDEEKTF